MTPPTNALSFLRDRAVLKRISAVMLACALAGAAYGALATRWYRSALAVMPAKAQGGASAIAGLLGPELAGFAAELLGGSAEAARIRAVLESPGVSDAVIETLGLRARYGEALQEDAREALWRRCSVSVLPRPALVVLSCEDEDPQVVQRLLAAFAEHGNQAFRRAGLTSASQEVRFLEGRVAELREQADAAVARMRAFGEEHAILDLDTEVRGVVSELATLDRQQTARELELDLARTFSGSEEATLRQLEAQLSALRRQARALEDLPLEGPPAEAGEPPRGSGVFPAALAVPRLREELASLYRDRLAAELTLFLAQQRLEDARQEEARDVSTFLVLDPPALPTRASWPAPLALAATFALLGLAAALGHAAWRAGALALLDPRVPSRSGERPPIARRPVDV